MYSYHIMYKYNGVTEEIDSADSERDALILFAEYQIAYKGVKCEVWIEKRRV